MCAPSAAKFAAVLGTSSPNRPMTILPAGSSPIEMSKNTFCVTTGSAARALKKSAQFQIIQVDRLLNFRSKRLVWLSRGSLSSRTTIALHVEALKQWKRCSRKTYRSIQISYIWWYLRGDRSNAAALVPAIRADRLAVRFSGSDEAFTVKRDGLAFTRTLGVESTTRGLLLAWSERILSTKRLDVRQCRKCVD